MQILVCNRAEAVALAKEFNQDRFLPYDHVKDGKKFPVSNSYDMAMDTVEGRCRRLNLYSRLQYLAGRPHTDVAKSLDHVTGQLAHYECGCKVHMLFDPEAKNDDRVFHGHRSEVFCPAHKNLDNPHDHMLAAHRDNQRTQE